MELFAFPFAGGGEHCYRELEPYALNYKLRTQAMPGRGSLIAQPCIKHIDAMTDYLLARIKPELQRPYMFFGHSMGAFVAYMLTKKIIALNLPAPKALILSGRKAPSAFDDELKHQLPREAFRRMLRDLGGIPDVVWQDAEMMGLFEPIIRADFELIETYSYAPSEPFDIPIYMLMGEDDNVTEAEAVAWQNETTQPLNLVYLTGGHFYFQNNWKTLAEHIDTALSEIQ